MSRTIPQEWSGPYNITEDKVEAFKEQYRISLGDEDKAGDLEDHEWYSGWRCSLEWVLNVLYDRQSNYRVIGKEISEDARVVSDD